MLKTSDWIEVGGLRFLVVDVGTHVLAISRTGTVQLFTESQCTPLPDCTGWDWLAVVMKDGGYYVLANGSQVGPVEMRTSYYYSVTPNQATGYWWDEDGKHENPDLSIVKQVNNIANKFQHITTPENNRAKAR